MTKKNATPKNETDRRLVGIARRCRFSATPKTKPTAAGSELLGGVASRLYRYDDRRGLNNIWKRVGLRFQYGPSSRTRSYAKLCNRQSNKSMFSARELKYSQCIRRPLRKGNFFTWNMASKRLYGRVVSSALSLNYDEWKNTAEKI